MFNKLSLTLEETCKLVIFRADASIWWKTPDSDLQLSCEKRLWISRFSMAEEENDCKMYCVSIPVKDWETFQVSAT